MPFTPAHAAAAWPLRWLSRGRLVTSAVVVGTITPDLEYLFRLETDRTVSHTALGLVTFCLPVGLVALVLLDVVVRRPFLRLVPARWAHLAAAADRPIAWRRPGVVAAVVASVLVGAVSHLLWDLFTHTGEWPAQRIAWLGEVQLHVGGTALRGARVLQLLSSVAGLAVTAVWAHVWARRQPPDPRIPVAPTRERVAVLAATVLTAAAGALLAFTRADPFVRILSTHEAVARPLVGAMSGAVAFALAYGAFSRVRS